MEKEKFTLRQKWLPGFADGSELHSASSAGNEISDGIYQVLYRWARSLFLTGALIWGGYQGIGNNIEYSEGQKVGVVNAISEKGLIWKTKEGQLSLEGRTSTDNPTGAGIWDFSIDRLAKHGENVDGLYSQIENAMKNDQKVKITYKQPTATWPWRAGTTYLVQSVEPLKIKAKD